MMLQPTEIGSRHGYARVAVCLLALLLLANPLTAATAHPVGDTQHSLQGQVVAADATARPVSGALVTLVEAQRRVLTDRAGRFHFANLPPGTYRLQVRSPGFQARERTVSVGAATEVAQLTIALEPAVFEVDEVIATASPLGSPSGYQAAQAFGREALQRRAATSLGEMLDGEPGLAMRSFGAATARPVIRGLDGDRVLVLENGERMGDLQETAADHAISMDPLAAERVEVVRGPASLLYGSSALGGVVNLLNDDLPRQWSRGTSGTIALQGATGNRLGAGFGRVAHGGEGWLTSARFSYRNAGNQTTPEGPLPGTHSTVLAGSAGFGYTAAGFDGGLSLGIHRNSYGIPEELDGPDEEVEIRMARQTLQGRAAWQHSGLLEHLELRFNAARFDQREIEIERLVGGLVKEGVELEFLQHLLSSTLTLRHAPLGFFDAGALGLSVFGREIEVGGEEAFTPSARSASVAIFTLQEVPLTPIARLQLGARWENQWMRPVPNQHFAGVEGQRRTQSVSGAVGINLRPWEGFEFGTQFARAHRTPTLEELFADGPHLGAGAYEVGEPTLANEIGHGLDAFARWTSARTRLEVAGFVNRIDGFVIFQPTGGTDERSGLPVFRYEGSNARLLGAEAGIEALLADALVGRLAADFVHGSRRDPAAAPLPAIPPRRARLGLTYSPARWWVGGEARLAATQHRVAPGEEPTPGYTLLGFDAGYRFGPAGHHLLTLRLDNALNTAYRDHLSRVEDRNFPMPGRSLNLVYRWTF
jgi:iron complex outermembrane recepter protein